MKLRLRVMSPGKWEGKVIPITLSEFLIGRDPQCQLRPASPLISKRHCAIVQAGNTAVLRDFGSTNGTFVNGQRVKGEVKLKNEQHLKIGPIEFMIELEASTPIEPVEAAANDTAFLSMSAEAEISTEVEVPAIVAERETRTASNPEQNKDAKVSNRKQSSREAARNLLDRYMKRNP
jgi:pSer/pThr/pTyr-binding forkhead associated (FHA) protein